MFAVNYDRTPVHEFYVCVLSILRINNDTNHTCEGNRGDFHYREGVLER